MKNTSSPGDHALQIVSAAGPILSQYSAIFCDVWGVAHDGHRAYAGANVALKKFREHGGVVIMVSNAPVPKARVQAMLDRVGFWREAWDDIVSSGDIALRHVADKGYQRLYCIGPADRDETFFQALPQPAAKYLREADAIVCTGLNDDINETPDDYRALLSEALELDLPFVCANPDLVVDVGGKLYLCAGAIAEVYEKLGGYVFWAGKPHRAAFATALRQAEVAKGEIIPRDRIIAIGDGLRTDIKAAQGMGIDAIFVAGGIHRDETMVDGRIDPDKLAALCSDDVPRDMAVMAELSW